MGLTRPPRAVTIDDVADKAGVSAKTVSRVLNNEPNVRPAKRELVLKASRELGYRPNPAARSLAGSRSFLLAHLHDNPVPEYVSAVNEGIYDACRANGYFLLPERVDRDKPDRLQRLQTFLLASRADGVILSPPLCDDEEIVALLKDTKTPYASLSPARQPKDTPVMRHDDHKAARVLVELLISLGHERIAMITGPEGHTASTRRSSGFLETMREAGLPVDDSLVIEGDYSIRAGIEATQKLLTVSPRPTAIFAANDDMAVGAMTVLMASGLKIPEDISIVGHDDTRLASAIWPALTTIRQPVYEMASRAAERLMTPEDTPLEEIFEFELIVRDSTGPAPK